MFALLLCLVQAHPLGGGQEPLPLLHVEVPLADYGMTSAGEVMRGRVSVAFTEDGPRMGLSWVRRTAVAPAGGPPPSPRLPDVPLRVADRPPLPAPGALWVWETRALLQDAVTRLALVDFVARHGIQRVFLQLAPASGEEAVAGFVPFGAQAMGGLVAALDSVGTKVYALDGDPAYALARNHPGVWRTVDHVAAYNRSVPPGRRFAGVHYDVEPYLLPAFNGPRRGEILNGYVQLLAGVARRAHAAGLSVGVDVPFWLDQPDEETGVPLEAELDGRTRPVLDHVLAVADEIAVMDYRTRPDGPDGIVAHAVGELERAASAHVGVLVGLEAGPLPDEVLLTFAGTGWPGLPPENGRWVVLSPATQEGAATLWLVDGSEAREALEHELAGVDPAGVRHWPAGRPVDVPATKQSFQRLGPGRLADAAARAGAALAPFPAFRGIAYHSYASVEELLRRR